MIRKFSRAAIENFKRFNQSGAHSFVGPVSLIFTSFSLYFAIKFEVSKEIQKSDQHHQELVKIMREDMKIMREDIKSSEQRQENLLKSIHEDMKFSEQRQENLLKIMREDMKSSELRQEKLLDVLTQRLDSTEKRLDYLVSEYRSVGQTEINSSN